MSLRGIIHNSGVQYPEEGHENMILILHAKKPVR